MITRIPLFAVKQAVILATARAKARRALDECLREIDRDDPLRDKVHCLYRDALTAGAYAVFFNPSAIGSRA